MVKDGERPEKAMKLLDWQMCHGRFWSFGTDSGFEISHGNSMKLGIFHKGKPRFG